MLIGLSNFLNCSIFSNRVLERDLVLSTLIVELELSSSPSSSPLKEEVEEPKEECKESLSLPLSSSSSSLSSSLSSSSSNRGLLFKKRFNVKLLSLLLRALIVF